MISKERVKNNFQKLTGLVGNQRYFEEELFAKFQDAFIMACDKPAQSGLLIVHGSRSMIKFKSSSFGKKSGEVVGELADMVLVAVQPSTKKMRMLLMQMKCAKSTKAKELRVEIPNKQKVLYDEHPQIESVGNSYYFSEDILRHSVGKSLPEDRDITMFGVFYKKSKTVQAPLADLGTDCGASSDGRLIPPLMEVCISPTCGSGGIKKPSDEEKECSEIQFVTTKELVPVSGSGVTLSVGGDRTYKSKIGGATEYNLVDKVLVVDYISNLGSFLDALQCMKVGREIDLHDLYGVVPEKFIPQEVKDMFPDSKACDNQNRNGKNSFGNKVFPSLIYINVDQITE